MGLATLADRHAELSHGIDLLVRDYCDHFGVSRDYAAMLLELKASSLRKEGRQREQS